jgi:hypothetical protein
MNGDAGDDMNGNRADRNARVRRVAALGALVCAVAASRVAYGQDAAPADASDVGRATKDWLAMQRDNRAAAPTQPMLGDVASLVYQRYLDSFKNKIPTSMSSQLGGMSGGAQGAQ